MNSRRAGLLNRLLIRLHLREKMIITFLLFGFLPMLVASIALQNMVISDLKRQTQEASLLALSRTAQRVDDKLNAYNLIANGIAFDSQLINMLSAPYPQLGQSIDLYHYISRQRTNIIRVNPEIKAVTIYATHSDLVSATPYLIRLDELELIPSFEQIRTAQYTPYLSGVAGISRQGDFWVRRGDPEMRLFSLNRLITRPNSISRPLGIVTLGIDEGALYALIDTNMQHATTMVIDGDGIVVSASDRSLVGRPAGDRITGEFLRQTGDEGQLFQSEHGGMLLVGRALNWGWRLATLISISDVQASARRVQATGILVTLLCAAVAIALVAYVSGKMVGRFQLLIDKFSISPSGLVDAGEHIEGRDEIALLDERFREMTQNLNRAIHELYEVELEKREATLVTLQSRINPHFLYNTLSSIGWMTETHEPQQVRGALELLATYYRASLSGGRDVISLKEEIEGLSAYLTIQKSRAGGRLRAAVMIDPMLDDIQLPKMTLQPIVENSIEHGFDADHPIVTILITSAVEPEAALIHIADDGVGISDEMLQQVREGSVRSASGGYGIQNVQMRLKLHFGQGYGLSVERLPQGGTRVTVRVPLCP